MTATKALNKLSGFTPSGKKRGYITFAVKRRVISGTPLMNSIKTTHNDFMIGIFDLLPRAKRILKGNARPIPVTPKKSVTSKPPHLFVPTVLNPGPPYNMKYAINGKRKVK